MFMSFIASFLMLFLQTTGEELSAIQQLVVGVLTFGSLLFFLFWGVLFLFFIILSGVFEKYWPIGFVTTIILFLIWYSGVSGTINSFVENPLSFVFWIVIYLVSGAVWMTFRWFRNVKKRVAPKRAKIFREFFRDKFSGVLKQYSRQDTDPDVVAWKVALLENGFAETEPEDLTSALKSYMGYGPNHGPYDGDIGTPTDGPKFGSHKWDHATYFFYWPIDFIVYFLSDLLKDLWTWFITTIQEGYDRITKRMLKQKIEL